LGSRETERGAKRFLASFVVRAAPFALLLGSRKTERGAERFLASFVVRAAPFALLRNSPALLSRSPARKAWVRLVLCLEVRPRFCGLASVGRDPLRLALFDLGLLLTLVHLGHWDSTARGCS
jgi:hypothetical protein